MAKPTPDQTIDRLVSEVVKNGGERLAATNPWEVARFRTLYGVGVIYRNSRGRQTWTPEAEMARDHLKAQKGRLAPVTVVGRTNGPRKRAQVLRILQRDGHQCFLCGLPLEADITIEHLVPLAHGGPNHISNLFCAHYECNRDVGHMSAPEKIAIILSRRAASQPPIESASPTSRPFEARSNGEQSK